jgi:hypothetical protein
MSDTDYARWSQITGKPETSLQAYEETNSPKDRVDFYKLWKASANAGLFNEEAAILHGSYGRSTAGARRNELMDMLERHNDKTSKYDGEMVPVLCLSAKGDTRPSQTGKPCDVVRHHEYATDADIALTFDWQRHRGESRAAKLARDVRAVALEMWHETKQGRTKGNLGPTVNRIHKDRILKLADLTDPDKFSKKKKKK